MDHPWKGMPSFLGLSRLLWVVTQEEVRVILCMNNLSKEERRLLSLRLIEDHAIDECAQVLNLSKTTIEKYVNSVCGKLNQNLTDEITKMEDEKTKDILGLVFNRIDQEFSS